MLRRFFTSITHRITDLPVLVLMPHSRCNCRCVMCDIWKANEDKHELSAEDMKEHIESFKRLHVKQVALSGGEALMHSNLWKLCAELRKVGIKISLLSTGITLKRFAREIIEFTDDVIVSIDGSQEVHDRIRNIPNAFEKLRSGVDELKRIKPGFQVTGRCVLQKLNYFDFFNIIQAAREIKLDQISFLPADVSSQAFNRPTGWDGDKVHQVALNREEVMALEELLVDSFDQLADDYRTRFIAESPKKMLEIPEYYYALLDSGKFPRKKCNAPWVSAVVEADGAVRPCFFHDSYGNLHEGDFDSIINSEKAVSFRKNLNVKTDPTCERCVCALYR